MSPMSLDLSLTVVFPSGGGTGFVGKGIRRAFEKKGYEVVDISRNGGPKRITWGEVKRNGLPSQTDVVINVAGENYLNPTRRWTKSFVEETEQSRLGTTTLLARAVANSPVKSWISTSATSYYPLTPSGGTQYSEDSQVPTGGGYLQDLVWRLEDAAVLPETCPTSHAVLRLGVVLGPWGGMVGSLWHQMNFNVGGTIGSGHQVVSWIHLDDLAQLFLFVTEKGASGAFNATSPKPITMDKMIQAFANAMGRKAVFWSPDLLMKTIFDGPRANILLKGNRVLPKRALDIGFQFTYSDIYDAFYHIVQVRHSGHKQ